MTPVAVGIDLGSSGVRAVALAPGGEVRAWVYEPFTEAGTWPAGRADPGVWLIGLRSVLAKITDIGLEIAAIGIGGQSPTTVPVATSKSPRKSPAHTRADSANETHALGMAVTCRHWVGNGLSLREQHLAQLEFLSQEIGETVAGAEIWDWALRCLGADNVQGVWPGEPALPEFGKPVPVAEVAGWADGSLGITPDTPLVSGHNDAYMSFWAGGLGTPGRGHDPGGRTGGLGVAIAAKDRPDHMMSFTSPVAGVEVVGGPVNGHGELLEWWSTMTGQPINSLLDRAAEVPPGAGGVLILPYHEGERAPRWSPDLRGEIHGLRFTTSVAEISRAVLEAAAYGLRHILEDLRLNGVTMDVMGCGGSPALSRVWCEIKASVLQVPVEVPARPEQLSAHGCAMAAGAAISWWPGVGTTSMDGWPLVPMTRIEPTTNTDVIEAYDAGYERFVSAGDAAVARLETAL